jgi:hypothetical protein
MELCGECVEQQFPIDLPALRSFLERQQAGDAAASDLRVIAQLEKLRSIEPECLQFGIVRV